MVCKCRERYREYALGYVKNCLNRSVRSREFAKERGLNEKTVRDIWNEVKCVGKAEADPDNLTSIQRVYVLVVEPLSHEKEVVSPKELMERYRRRFVVAAEIKSANRCRKAVDQQRD